jgi:hypothetical protein
MSKTDRGFDAWVHGEAGCQCPACLSPFVPLRLPRAAPLPPISRANSQVLTALIVLAEAVIAREHVAFDRVPDLCALEPDLRSAIARPADGPRHVGAAELMLHAALQQIAGGHIGQLDLSRYRAIAAHALLIVRDHLFAALLAEQRPTS